MAKSSRCVRIGQNFGSGEAYSRLPDGKVHALRPAVGPVIVMLDKPVLDAGAIADMVTKITADANLADHL